MTKEQDFYLTGDHIKLLRELTFIWDSEEGGAPVVDPSRIYGSSDQYGDMLRILGKEDQAGKPSEIQKAELDQRQQELSLAFEIALQHAALVPGDYSYEMPPESQSDTDLDDEMLASDRETIEFHFTDEHLTLLRAANGGWLDYWDTLGINSKRPYGDMTYFELDMAALLGIPVSHTAQEKVTFTQEQSDHLTQLHSDLRHSLPILLKYGQLQTGHYRRIKEYDPWQFVGSTGDS